MGVLSQVNQDKAVLAAYQFKDWGENHQAGKNPGNVNLLGVKTDSLGRQFLVEVKAADVNCWNRFRGTFNCGPLANINIKLKDLHTYLNSYSVEALQEISKDENAQKTAFEISYRAMVHKKTIDLYERLGKANNCCKKGEGSWEYYIPTTGIPAIALRAYHVAQEPIKHFNGHRTCLPDHNFAVRSVRKRDVGIRKYDGANINQEDKPAQVGNVSYRGKRDNKVIKLAADESLSDRYVIRVEGFDGRSRFRANKSS